MNEARRQAVRDAIGETGSVDWLSVYDAGYAAAQARWTRVEDGLPTGSGHYLVTTHGRSNGIRTPAYVGIDFISEVSGKFDDPDVVAWMPLPAPFIGETK